MSIYQELSRIQKELKVSKSQRNTFGNYNYRSNEDILEAVKPLLNELTLVQSDEIVLIGDRYYVKATATLSDGKEAVNNIAYAREEETKKGMDGSQITGAASSYARKYALNGLFAIDDTKDADSTNTHDDKSQSKSTVSANTVKTVSKPISGLHMHCSIHNAEMEERKSSKNGNPYFSHIVDGKHCFGLKEDQKKLAEQVMKKPEPKVQPIQDDSVDYSDPQEAYGIISDTEVDKINDDLPF